MFFMSCVPEDNYMAQFDGIRNKFNPGKKFHANKDFTDFLLRKHMARGIEPINPKDSEDDVINRGILNYRNWIEGQSKALDKDNEIQRRKKFSPIIPTKEQDERFKKLAKINTYLKKGLKGKDLFEKVYGKPIIDEVPKESKYKIEGINQIEKQEEVERFPINIEG